MNRIKELREAKGLSQDKLSQELNINLRTIQRWENGETAIRRNNAEKIAKFFNISVPELLGYELPPVLHPGKKNYKICISNISEIKNS